MKKILITGVNSYIGTSFEKWVSQWTDKYYVDTVDMIDGTWKEKDFSEYDVVFHVAGIAHLKETKENTELYYRVNRDLVYEVAQKAKGDGVKQFIFLSSMSVYGIESGLIDRKSPTDPNTNYGKAKLQAEELIARLTNEDFNIAVLRPPMIYGKGCKGNYPRLTKLALTLPLFPDIANERSMIYIDNLCEFIRLLIDGCSRGLFFPQNKEYVCTTQMVKLIAETHGKKIRVTKLLWWVVWIGTKVSVSCRKVFGSLTYSKEMAYADCVMNDLELTYKAITFEDSIKCTEKCI